MEPLADFLQLLRENERLKAEKYEALWALRGVVERYCLDNHAIDDQHLENEPDYLRACGVLNQAQML